MRTTTPLTSLLLQLVSMLFLGGKAPGKVARGCVGIIWCVTVVLAISSVIPRYVVPYALAAMPAAMTIVDTVVGIIVRRREKKGRRK